MHQSALSASQVTIIGHERPSRIRASPGAEQLPAEFRSALELAQAAVWDWQLARRSVPGRRGLAARVRHRRRVAAPMPVRRMEAAHPSRRSRRVHRGDRFLPSRRRTLRVRIPVVSRRASLAVGAASRPRRATRARRRRAAHHRVCCSTSTGARARRSRAATASRGSRPRCGARARRSGSGTCRAMRAPRVRCGSR